MEQEQVKNEKSSKLRFGIVATIGLAIVAGLIFWKPKNEKSTSDQINKNLSTLIDRKKYTNGTYSALGDYSSPAGKEQIYITLVLKDNTVVNASAEVKAENPGSKKMQEAFVATFKTEVIGKNIDEVSLDVVNGSSLTPKGFMDALSKIKAESQIAS